MISNLWSKTPIRFTIGYIIPILFFQYMLITFNLFITPDANCGAMCEPKTLAGISMLFISPLAGFVFVGLEHVRIRKRGQSNKSILINILKGLAYVWIAFYVIGFALFLLSTEQSEDYWGIWAAFALFASPWVPILVISDELFFEE